MPSSTVCPALRQPARGRAVVVSAKTGPGRAYHVLRLGPHPSGDHPGYAALTHSRGGEHHGGAGGALPSGALEISAWGLGYGGGGPGVSLAFWRLSTLLFMVPDLGHLRLLSTWASGLWTGYEMGHLTPVWTPNQSFRPSQGQHSDAPGLPQKADGKSCVIPKYTYVPTAGPQG